MSLLRKFILFDANGRELELTPQSNVPVEVVDSNGLNLDLTAQSNLPVEVVDSNGLNLDLTPQSNLPVEVVDSNGLNLDLTTNSYVPNENKNNFKDDVSLGRIPGAAPFYKFGRSIAVDANYSVIWDAGGIYTFLETAETLDLVSTSANDAAGGTGATSILILGLDANYNEISELIIPQGLTPVTTNLEFLRQDRAVVITSGLNIVIGDANDGLINVSGTVSGITTSEILPNNGQTLMLVYTVPAGKTLIATGFETSAGQGKNANIRVITRNGPDSTDAFSVKYTIELYESAFTTPVYSPLGLSEKTDIVVTAATSSGTISVSGTVAGTLYDN